MKTGSLLAVVLACASAQAQEFVDPTRPVSAAAEAFEPVYSGPVLQSTMVAPGLKRAVISGKSYTVGERVGNATVTDIRPYEVVLEQGGRETRLRMVPPLAKEIARPKDDRANGVNP